MPEMTVKPINSQQKEAGRKISLSDFPQHIQDDVYEILAKAAIRKAKREAENIATNNTA